MDIDNPAEVLLNSVSFKLSTWTQESSNSDKFLDLAAAIVGNHSFSLGDDGAWKRHEGSYDKFHEIKDLDEFKAYIKDYFILAMQRGVNEVGHFIERQNNYLARQSNSEDAAITAFAGFGKRDTPVKKIEEPIFSKSYPQYADMTPEELKAKLEEALTATTKKFNGEQLTEDEIRQVSFGTYFCVNEIIKTYGIWDHLTDYATLAQPSRETGSGGLEESGKNRNDIIIAGLKALDPVVSMGKPYVNYPVHEDGFPSRFEVVANGDGWEKSFADVKKFLDVEGINYGSASPIGENNNGFQIYIEDKKEAYKLYTILAKAFEKTFLEPNSISGMERHTVKPSEMAARIFSKIFGHWRELVKAKDVGDIKKTEPDMPPELAQFFLKYAKGIGRGGGGGS